MPTSPLPPDPYKILGVDKEATIATIRSAHRKLVLLSHPDKFPDEAIKAQKAEEFHRVQQAYEILSDDKTRENYNARVRLAELKAARFQEEASSPKRQDPPYSPRPSAERVWTTQPIFEEIRPKTRYYDDHPIPSSRSEQRYEEYRRREYDEVDDFVPHGTTRKAASSRISEVRTEDLPSRPRQRWKSAGAKIIEKSREKEHEERRRARDKTRRDNVQSKHQHNRSSFDGEIASDLGSDVEDFMTYGRKERNHDDDRYHSRRKYESRAGSPDRETEAKASYNFHSAAEYIAKSLGGSKDRRSSVGRGQSANQIPPAPPPPPPAPVAAAVEDVTRSSAGRRNATSKPTKSSKYEIVEPPRKRDYEPETRPDLKASMTSPTGLKPPRSATMDSRGSEPSRTQIRRSATSPLVNSVSASHSQKPSKRDTHDSGYSSPGTPDNQNSRSKTTTSYRVLVESGSESDGARVVEINPDSRRPQVTREQGLHSASQRSERATGGSGSTRHATMRSHTDEQPSHHRRPATLNRGATAGPLYGEVPRPSHEPRVRYDNVHESPQYHKKDVQYASYHGRSPPSDNDPRQAYAQHGRSRTGVPRAVRA